MPAIDAAVQVTTTPSSVRAHAIPVLAVDPRNSNVIALAEGETRTSRCSLHISTNAGLSWEQVASPQPESAPRCVRNTEGPIADITFGSDGTLYYAFPGWPLDDWHSQIFVGRSSDLGRTFQTVGLGGETPAFERGYAGSNALPAVRVDPENPKRVYVAWSSNYGLWNLEGQVPGGAEGVRKNFKRRPYLAVSDDGGASFSEPVDMAGDMQESVTQPSITIAEGGTLHAFFGETQVTDFGEDVQEGHLFHAVSSDGGKTFTSKPIHTQPAGIDFTYLNSPSAAASPEKEGEVYVAWEDTGKQTPKVLFMSSRDDGKTWSPPVKLNSVDPGRQWDFQEFNPWISVAPNGRIDAAWYDWRDDVTFVPGPKAKNSLQHVYSSFSEDGGRTWSPNVRVTDRAIDRTLSDVWQNGVHGPVGLASVNDRAYLAWDDSRNAVGESKAQDIYFTRLHIDPAGRASGLSAAGTSTSTKVQWAVLGLAFGLAVAGIALLVSRRAFSPRGPLAA